MFKRKTKSLDAQAVPIEERIDKLEKTAQHNQQSKTELSNAIDKAINKIDDCVDGLSTSKIILCRRCK